MTGFILTFLLSTLSSIKHSTAMEPLAKRKKSAKVAIRKHVLGDDARL